jgi:hypothetical protein
MYKLKKIVLVLFATLSWSGLALSNDIYVEQIGDGTTVNLTQDGTGNTIGSLQDAIFIGGNSNTVNVTQTGNSNQLAMLANGDSTDVTITTTGNGNNQTVSCGTSANPSCSGSTITQTITGDDNIVKQEFLTGANHTSNISITGDSNRVTHISTATGISNVDITLVGGTALSPNNISVTQSGSTNQNITVNSSGNGNTIAINQSN